MRSSLAAASSGRRSAKHARLAQPAHEMRFGVPSIEPRTGARNGRGGSDGATARPEAQVADISADGKGVIPDVPRLWQIFCEGYPMGPHAEPDLIEAIERGQLLTGQCRPLGDLRWRALKSEPIFAEALKRAARTVTLRPVRSR